MENTFKFGRLWGIEIGAHVSWLLIFGLVTWSFGGRLFPARFPEWSVVEHWGIGLVTSLLFFASVLAHELAHARVALNFGTPVRRIVLFVLGGLAQVTREAPTARAEFWIALAGPASSLALAGGFYGLAWAAGPEQPMLRGPALELGSVNLLLATFNLIPGFPLDGGRLLRAGVWKLTRNFRTATRFAVRSGQALALGFVALGGVLAFRGEWLDGLWLGFVGWFLMQAATASDRSAGPEAAPRGMPVSRVMSQDFRLVPAYVTVQTFVDNYLVRAPRLPFLVADQGRLAGVVTLDDIRQVPLEARARVRLGDTLSRGRALAALEPDDDVEQAFRVMSEGQIGQLPVVQNGTVVGLVTRHRLQRLLEAESGDE